MAFAILRNSGDETIANNTLTSLTWDTEDVDSGGLHSAGAATVTLGGGLWLLIAIVSWDLNSTGYREVIIFESGVNIAFMSETGVANTRSQRMSLPILWQVPTGGATYEVKVQQSSGGNLNVLGVRSSYFMVAGLQPHS